MQSVLPAVYPILKTAYRLDFGQIGLITFANQATASLLQPVVGSFTDRSPRPYSLPTGMAFTLVGLLLLSVAPTYGVILLAVALVGIGSSVFHPESSRVARLASGHEQCSDQCESNAWHERNCTQNSVTWTRPRTWSSVSLPVR